MQQHPCRKDKTILQLIRADLEFVMHDSRLSMELPLVPWEEFDKVVEVVVHDQVHHIARLTRPQLPKLGELVQCINTPGLDVPEAAGQKRHGHFTRRGEVDLVKLAILRCFDTLVYARSVRATIQAITMRMPSFYQQAPSVLTRALRSTTFHEAAPLISALVANIFQSESLQHVLPRDDLSTGQAAFKSLDTLSESAEPRVSPKLTGAPE
ncbi:hypothetical protein ST47_g9778 [Ascochyta rabiei]|uniref:Uncharacterized protein n=1 Tax=Didymella rabiei TaxID=5454 RepID=A0A162WKN3_DIDRA|nr:hypothetical protein ST47_g9778 [Ascochyta rabiei]